MATVTFNGTTFICSRAVKGSDYIHLLDSDGQLVASFGGISDFSGFSISGGNWETAAACNDCNIAVLREGSIVEASGTSLNSINTSISSASTRVGSLETYIGKLYNSLVNSTVVTLAYEIEFGAGDYLTIDEDYSYLEALQNTDTHKAIVTGITGWNPYGNNVSQIDVYRVRFNTTNKHLYLGVRNRASSSTITCTIYVYLKVIYVPIY